MTEKPEFDIYPKLDGDIKAAAGNHGNSDLEAIVAEHEQEKGREREDEIRNWAAPQIMASLKSLKEYEILLFGRVPQEVELTTKLNDFPKKINDLYKLYEFMKDRDNDPISAFFEVAENMRLVVIPWAEFKDHLPTINSWLSKLRVLHNGRTSSNEIPPTLQEAIKSAVPFYTHPDNPDMLLTAEQYLELRIEQDGMYGIMLVQTDRVGDRAEPLKTADYYTSNGSSNFTADVDGEKISVSDMGLFEWLALTLQNENQESLNRAAYIPEGENTFLLANRLRDTAGRGLVPVGSAGSIEGDFGMGLALANTTGNMYLRRCTVR